MVNDFEELAKRERKREKSNLTLEHRNRTLKRNIEPLESTKRQLEILLLQKNLKF